MLACFAFLPHVRVQAGPPLTVGPFILWRNSRAEWKSRFGADNTAFFDMYRDERGEAVGENASLLSLPNYADASYEHFRDAIYCLSTAVWMRDRTSADAWVFERWMVHVPTPADMAFTRHGKFSTNYTSADVDRIYPTPYTHRINLSPYTDQSDINFFAAELSKPRESSTLSAFSHFHLARFETPYFTSTGDAVEAMWSGFESLLQIDAYGSRPPPRNSFERLFRAVLSLLPGSGTPERVGKTEKLRLALRSVLQGYPDAKWRDELWTGITAWSKQFYSERNHHSHGARADLLPAEVEPYGMSAFEIALHIARTVLRLQMQGTNPLFAYDIGARLNSLFLLEPTVKRVTVLRNHDRKAWFPGTGTDGAGVNADAVEEVHRTLSELTELRIHTRRFRGRSDVASARKKMGLVLSAWAKDLGSSPPSGANVTCILQVPTLIGGWASAGIASDEIDTKLAEALVNVKADDADTFGPDARAEPRLYLRSKIPIWLWAHGFIKLTELFLGHDLR